MKEPLTTGAPLEQSSGDLDLDMLELFCKRHDRWALAVSKAKVKRRILTRKRFRHWGRQHRSAYLKSRNQS